MRVLFAFLVTVAVASPLAVAQAKIAVTINKSSQRMIVSVDGEPRYNWPVSTGRAGHDTPSGQHRAFRMEKDHYSKEWDDAPMPNSIFFTKVGHAIHGTYDTKKIGSPASAGCVRLAPENAETLFALVEKHGVLNTTVEIAGDMRVALARRGVQPAANEANDNRATQRGYGSYERGYGSYDRGYGGTQYAEPVRPRYEEPYGGPYSLRQPQYHYGPPPGAYEQQPRYFRW